jgi:hypothetical protein
MSRYVLMKRSLPLLLSAAPSSTTGNRTLFVC